MNTYMIKECKRCKSILTSQDPLSSELIDHMTGAFEMMKMEIEQHITNMPASGDEKSMRDAAQNAIRKILAILDLLEELLEDKDLIPEIVCLMDEFVC